MFQRFGRLANAQDTENDKFCLFPVPHNIKKS